MKISTGYHGSRPYKSLRLPESSRKEEDSNDLAIIKSTKGAEQNKEILHPINTTTEAEAKRIRELGMKNRKLHKDVQSLSRKLSAQRKLNEDFIRGIVAEMLEAQYERLHQEDVERFLTESSHFAVANSIPENEETSVPPKSRPALPIRQNPPGETFTSDLISSSAKERLFQKYIELNRYLVDPLRFNQEDVAILKQGKLCEELAKNLLER